jgi:hypothetical protein
MKKNITNLTGFTIAIIFGIIFISCEKKEIRFSRINKNQVLAKGEWFSKEDSLLAMSIRSNRIVFIEDIHKLTFTEEDRYSYSIIDSFKMMNNKEIKIGEYLSGRSAKDTIFYKIINRRDSVIAFEVNNKESTFEWKYIARMVK